MLRGQGQVKPTVEHWQRREACAGRRRAVVAALQRDEMLLARLAQGVVVLHDEAHGRIHRFRAAQREVHVLQRRRRDLHQLVGQANGGLAAEVEVPRGIGQLAHLVGSSLHHALLPVAHVHAPQACERVQQLLALAVGQPNALCGGKDVGAALFVRAPGRYRVDQVGTVQRVQRSELGQGFRVGHGIEGWWARGLQRSEIKGRRVLPTRLHEDKG